jgi:hypothetical protein
VYIGADLMIIPILKGVENESIDQHSTKEKKEENCLISL